MRHKFTQINACEIVVHSMAAVATFLCGMKDIHCWFWWMAAGIGWWILYHKKELWVSFYAEFLWQILNIWCLLKWWNG